MKLYCLGGPQNRPCFVLKFKNTFIMLDCALDVQTLVHYLPLVVHNSNVNKLPSAGPVSGVKLEDELKECCSKVFVDGQLEFGIPELSIIDLSHVDAVLVSSFHAILALPFITECSDFRGVIYATEPTIRIGQLYMEELVEYIESAPKHNKAGKWKQPNILNFLPPPIRDAISPKSWKTCYNKHDIHSCMAKVHTVGFNETISIFGTLKASPLSSGCCLGSCNWVIQSDYEKISYVAASSTLTTHPKPMDQSTLRNSDILIMCSLRQALQDPNTMIGEFCITAATTLKLGGNVLVPCNPSGVTYDLFECLTGHLDSVGLSSVPMYFVSPVADNSLQYSNIYAEWLSYSKQSKVFLPEPPFPHAHLIESNRLRHYPNIHSDLNFDIKTPCIMFTGHPSLRMGNVLHFIDLWGNSSQNTIILTEPDYPYIEALAPFQPLNMKVAYCPIDTSLSFNQANKLVNDLKPSHLVVSQQLTAPPSLTPHNTDLCVYYDPPPLTYKRADVLNLPVSRSHQCVEMDASLAENLKPTEVSTGVNVATIHGQLTTRDNRYRMQAKETKHQWENKTVSQKLHLWGALDSKTLSEELRKEGIDCSKMSSGPAGDVLELSDDTRIVINGEETHIYCEGNDMLRLKLKDIIINLLPKF